MNTRSLKFQLIVWYAALLTGGFALLGVVTYLALQSSLGGALKEAQLRRARQIAQLLREEIGRENQTHVGSEIEARYAPGPNDRFVRITRKDGMLLYLSPAPKSQSFDPAALPPPRWPGVHTALAKNESGSSAGPSANVKLVNQAQFDSEVTQSSRPAAVDFFATW